MVPGRLVVSGAIFIATFVFRLSTVSLTNDDYLHLALAQQVLLGDVPVRDFIDPGEFLFYSLSAAFQFLFGQHLLSEVMLDVLLLAAGYTLVFLLASQASRSTAIGIVATAIAVLLFPRLYSYPKIFLYAAGLTLMWQYIDRRRTRELLLLAVWSAAAFTFRHDHGTAIGAASAVTLAITHRREGWPTMGRKVLYFATVAAVLLVPYLIFLQVNRGLVGYWRNTVATGRGEYERTVGPYPRFRPALASPRINVRWAGGIDDTARRALEQRFRLEAPEDRGGGTWQYDLVDASGTNIAALVHDPAVDDTSGVDRARFTVTAPVVEPNVLAWFYYLTLLLPPLSVLTLVWAARDASARGMQREKIASAAVLAALMQPFLLRAASQSAVADVGVGTAVLGAWLLRRGLSAWRPIDVRSLAGAALTVVGLAGTLAAAWRSDGAYALRGLAATLQNQGVGAIGEQLDQLRRSSPPFADAAAAYVFSCTEQSDRLLVTGYAPDLYYKSGRGFAAGRPYLLASLAPLPEYERFSLERLQNQRVPLVLAASGDNEFAPFQSIDGYVREHYRKAGEIRFGDAPYDVLADVRISPACSYGQERLPCFRQCGAPAQ